MTELHPPDKRKEPEIRYVPVQFIEGYAPQSGNDEVEIDLMDILKRIWDGRKTIIKITVVFAVIGVLFAFGSPNEYTTTTKLLPEVQQTNNLGRLGGLAAQFGLGGVAGASGNDVLPAQIYPEILNSTSFLNDIVSKRVYFEEITDSITVQSFFNDHQKSNAFIGYTVGLPFKVLGLLRSEPDSVEALIVSNESYRRIPQDVMRSIAGLRQSVSNNREQQTGVLTITVTTQSPEVTVQIANHVTDALSTYLTDYRTEKTRRNLAFIQQRQAEARANFELEQERLARFRDQNQGNLTAAARTIEQNIQSEYDVKFSVYSSLTEQLEQARIKLEEDTPVVSVIQESIYPNRKSGPNRLLLLILSTFLGGIIGILTVMLKPVFISAKEKF
jgi:uncharacterized protein involved in exopolysaccharide biosynthesis